MEDPTDRAARLLDKYGIERLAARRPISSHTKFDTLATELLWELSLNSFHDEEIGNVEELGWYARFDPTDHDALGAIISADNHGFVRLEEALIGWQLMSRWGEIVEEYAALDEETEE